MNNEEKKKNERIILQKFFKSYKEQIDKSSSFIILDNETIKKTHFDYNGENPDFGVKFNGELIGIELTQLSKNDLEESQLKSEPEKKMKIKNVGHLHSLRKDDPNRPPYLYLMESIVDAATDRIKDKIKKRKDSKIKYINCPVWLVCYAVEPYNQLILSPLIEDGCGAKIAADLSEAIGPQEIFVSLWLAEFSGKDCLLKIPIQTLPPSP